MIAVLSFQVSSRDYQKEATMSAVVKPMKKLCLSIVAGAETGSSSFTPDPVTFSFIYGIGTGGMTPFEFALQDRRVGEKLRLEVKQEEAQRFFGRYLGSIAQALGLVLFPHLVHLEITLLEVTTAENAEIVQALAASVGCGGSCGCGC
jgi:hypothetical protein